MFILMIEGFVRFLKSTFSQDDFVGIQKDNNNIPMSHLYFVGFAMLMDVPIVNEACAIQNLLKAFIDSSTTYNYDQFQYFLLQCVFLSSKQFIKILIFGWGSFPTKYLGLPYHNFPNSPTIILRGVCNLMRVPFDSLDAIEN